MYFLPVECDMFFLNILNILGDKHFTCKMIMYVPHSIIKL